MPDATDTNEALRVEAAGAIRELVHAFAAHGADDEVLLRTRDTARELVALLEAQPARDRMALYQQAMAGRAPGEWAPGESAGFADRAVGGRANPTAFEFDTRRVGDEMHTDVTLGAACEGAPGRAHGGMVLAAFDDFTGSIVGLLGEPAFTGEITVRFVKPVPVREPLHLRTWLESRSGRKLDIHADATAGGEVVATCRATYITVDPKRFAAAPDPR